MNVMKTIKLTHELATTTKTKKTCFHHSPSIQVDRERLMKSPRLPLPLLLFGRVELSTSTAVRILTSGLSTRFAFSIY
jgi:hypothetical protein